MFRTTDMNHLLAGMYEEADGTQEAISILNKILDGKEDLIILDDKRYIVMTSKDMSNTNFKKTLINEFFEKNKVCYVFKQKNGRCFKIDFTKPAHKNWLDYDHGDNKDWQEEIDNTKYASMFYRAAVKYGYKKLTKANF